MRRSGTRAARSSRIALSTQSSRRGMRGSNQGGCTGCDVDMSVLYALAAVSGQSCRPGIHAAWKPIGTRPGSATRAIGPAPMRCASKIQASERVVLAVRRERDHVAAILCAAARALGERRLVAVPALRVLVHFARAALVVVLDEPIEHQRLQVRRNALVIRVARLHAVQLRVGQAELDVERRRAAARASRRCACSCASGADVRDSAGTRASSRAHLRTDRGGSSGPAGSSRPS